jgi:hypothetical protein
MARSVWGANAQSIVARSALPTMPIMEAAFAEKQRTMVEDNLLGWNHTNAAGGGTPGLPGQQPSQS